MSERIRVKICGIRNLETALVAAEMGADAIGLVFYERSPRFVTPEQADNICKHLPPFVNKVGLFVNAASDTIYPILEQVKLDTIQFHGDEPADFCHQFGIPYIKAVRMQAGVDLHSIMSEYANASAILLDAYVKGVEGGTGKNFDWSLIPKNFGKPIILAGGLNAGNVKLAIQQVSPYGVDVSGGVESEKGLKDPAKIKEFIREVNDAR